MTIYKALTNLVRRESQEVILSGTYFSDEGKYNPDDGVTEIATGEAVQNVRQAPPPILWRPSFLAERSQKDLNLLLGYAIEIVDATHEDYARLVEFDIVATKKTSKPSKPAVEGDK